MLDVRRVVLLDGLEEAVEPLLAHGGVHGRAADEGHQFPVSRVGGVAQGPRGAVNLAQRRGEFLQEQDGALGCRGGVLSGDSADFGEGFVDALDRELGAFPAECGRGEASAECPGMHEGSRRHRRTAPCRQASCRAAAVRLWPSAASRSSSRSGSGAERSVARSAAKAEVTAAGSCWNCASKKASGRWTSMPWLASLRMPKSRMFLVTRLTTPGVGEKSPGPAGGRPGGRRGGFGGGGG